MSNWLTDCAKDDNDDSRCTALSIGRTVSAVLSCVGCLFAIFVIVIYKKFRFFTQRMVAYLLIPCFFLASFSLSSSLGDTGCAVKGFFRNYAGLSQNFWIICIDLHVLLSLTIWLDRPAHLEKIYHGVVWGGALLISLIPWIGDHYGDAGFWCWIKGGDHYEHSLRVICYYLWLMILVFGGGGIYVYVIWKIMSRMHKGEAAKERYKRIRPLLFYPIVDLVLGSVSTANRIQNWANPGNPVFGLYLMHSIVSPLWGFVNALLYLMNRDTLHQLHPVTFWNAIKSWGKTTFTLFTCATSSNAGPQMENDTVTHPASHIDSSSADME